MIEILFSFSIFLTIASLLPLLFSIIFQQHSIDSRIQTMEWELFLHQLKKEVQRADSVDIVNGELTVVNMGEIVTFQQYKKLIRRRVDGKGHEVVLQNIENVTIEDHGYAFRMEVLTTFGRKESAYIYLFIDRAYSTVQ